MHQFMYVIIWQHCHKMLFLVLLLSALIILFFVILANMELVWKYSGSDMRTTKIVGSKWLQELQDVLINLDLPAWMLAFSLFCNIGL